VARILVVDDAAFMRKMVSDALTKGGHEVVGEAGNGNEAVARFQELKPELTTLDITMPEKDGLAALKEIIELDPGARVIMCSALGQESKVLESIKLGARDFVVKPFQAERVQEAVAKDFAYTSAAATMPPRDASRSSSKISRGSRNGNLSPRPSRRARSQMISESRRALPGGSTALLMWMTRASTFAVTPSSSS